ncbi:MAG: hypothetical protein ACOZNI_03860 [Myxococcota bacterium]
MCTVRTEHGKIGAAAAGIAGVGALGAWALRRRAPRVAIAGTLVLAVASGGVLAWVGYSGGQIRHPEIREKAPGISTW